MARRPTPAANPEAQGLDPLMRRGKEEALRTDSGARTISYVAKDHSTGNGVSPPSKVKIAARLQSTTQLGLPQV
jgi:hypothetical protein